MQMSIKHTHAKMSVLSCNFYGHDEEEKKGTKKWVIRMMIVAQVGAIFSDQILPQLHATCFSSLKESRE